MLCKINLINFIEILDVYKYTNNKYTSKIYFKINEKPKKNKKLPLYALRLMIQFK